MVGNVITLGLVNLTIWILAWRKKKITSQFFYDAPQSSFLVSSTSTAKSANWYWSLKIPFKSLTCF